MYRSPFSSMSLGPHIGLRFYEYSGDTFVPLSADICAILAAHGHPPHIEGDRLDLSPHVQRDHEVPVAVFLVRDYEQSDGVLRQSLTDFGQSAFVIVFFVGLVPPLCNLEGLEYSAVVTAASMQDLAILLRILLSPLGLISVDLSDVFSVWTGRVSEFHVVTSDELQSFISSCAPLEGAFLSFPQRTSLMEISTAIDRVEEVFPSGVEVVWRDGGEQPLNRVDLCISRRLEPWW